MRQTRRAFTLVELLVVIGIIAVLIAVLLPALGAARRQANATKCAAALRELGTCFNLYASEHRGYFPPAQLRPVSGVTYTIDATEFPVAATGAELAYPYWFNFIAKYVTKGKVGGDAFSAIEVGDARTRTIIWGCPEWEGIYSGTAFGGINRVQTGYGMNIWPTFTATNPRGTGFPGPSPFPDRNYIENWPGASMTGDFQKQIKYGKNAAERILLADSRWWALEASGSGATIPQQVVIGSAPSYTQTTTGRCTIDFYRHGKAPPISGTVYSTSNNFRVKFNALFSDGHVGTLNDMPSGYQGLRLRFPG